MPDKIELASWPASLNNLSWSKENILAVGVTENVNLLIPRYQQSGSSSSPWHVVSLNTSKYGQDEAPLMDPMTWAAFSLGEELSDRNTVAIDWSPAGIGKHGRSILAVLTSNHMLSLWACVGQPQLAEDWKRVLLINRTLTTDGSDTTVGTGPSDTGKRAIRIRSFAWAPAPSAARLNDKDRRHDKVHLAVATDDGNIHVLSISSPYDPFSNTRLVWTSSIVNTISPETSNTDSWPLARCLPSTHKRRPAFVDQLAWSPWSENPQGISVSTLAYTSQSELRYISVEWLSARDDVNIDLGRPWSPLPAESVTSITGPIAWVPRPIADGSKHLVTFSKGSILCLCSPTNDEMVQLSSHYVENEWDEIAGLAFNFTPADEPTVSFILHLTTQRMSVSRLALPLAAAKERLLAPPWQGDIVDAQAVWSARADLGGRVQAKLYGLAASPLGDYSATCFSYHPSDKLEYIIEANRTNTVIISREETERDSGLPAHVSCLPNEVTAECMYASLRRSLEFSDLAASNYDKIVEQMLLASGLSNASPNQTFATFYPDRATPEHLATVFRRQVMLHSDSVRSRYRRLVELAHGKSRKESPPDLSLIRRLATEITIVQRTLPADGPMGQSILRTCQAILDTMKAREEGVETTSAGSSSEIEKCTVCGSGITFEALKWARCSSGHQFGRCGLSFLIIPSPSAAKSCTICGTKYLNEYTMNAFEQKEEEAGATQVPNGDGSSTIKQGVGNESLVRMLFAACNACIYCGGNFMG